MADDFWEDDDLEYAGDFVADLDKIVEQHRSKTQVWLWISVTALFSLQD